MKQLIICILSAHLACITVDAKSIGIEPLPSITNDYIENILLASSYLNNNRDNYLVTSFLMENQKYFHSYDLYKLKEMVQRGSNDVIYTISGIEFKDPTVSIALSIFAGGIGADRFYIGDTGLGVAKLLTLGGLGLWWLIDMFVITNRTKDKNGAELHNSLLLYSSSQ